MVGVLTRFDLTAEKLRPFAIRGLVSFVQAAGAQLLNVFVFCSRKKNRISVAQRRLFSIFT